MTVPMEPTHDVDRSDPAYRVWLQ
ncbi:MAG: hypothetical protein JWL99_5196, partial [Streptomyces oryziradicis]|nr:hypothetical protein [Actinacidiphila oryziradicis]